MTTLDGRMRIVEVDVMLGQKLTWTYSFNLRTAECIGCKEHVNDYPFPRRGSQVRGGRQAIWLADQSIPPVLPSTSKTLQCVKIVRLEGGMLQELAEGLVRVLSGRQIAAGSTILMTSVTNMAAAGTAGYADDLFRAIKFLKRNLGDHLVYGPLPNFLMNGSEDPITIRTCWEFAAWAKFTFKEEASLLSSSFDVVEKQLAKRGVGGVQNVERCTLRLPTADGNNLLSFSSGAWDNIPIKVLSCSVTDEKEAVETIVGEIRDRLAIDLDPHPVVDRWPCPLDARPSDPAVKKMLFIGSSHAGKIAAALRKLGHHTDVIYEANWRATPLAVADMVDHISEKLDRTPLDAVIFCVVDNNVYYAMDEMGDLKLPVRDQEGVYHVKGDLTLASKSAQSQLFNNIRPMLAAARGRNMLLCAPMPRYLVKGCCTDQTHVANRSNERFEPNQLKELKELTDHLRDFLFTSGYRQVKVLDPAVSWRGKDTSTLWGEDPVHPKEEAYSLIGEGVIKMLTHMESGAKKRARTNSETGSGPKPTLNRNQGPRGGPTQDSKRSTFGPRHGR
jgi:hypothetical protein